MIIATFIFNKTKFFDMYKKIDFFKKRRTKILYNVLCDFYANIEKEK
jgi:hypothetical protein